MLLADWRCELMRHAIRFGEGPRIEPVIDKEVWRLTEDFRVEIDGALIVVPEGFMTDGASIPRFLWRLCGHPMLTKRFPIAVTHDFIYAEGLGYTRVEADEIYRDGLIVLGFKPRVASLEYYGIRLFGGSHWEGGSSV